MDELFGSAQALVGQQESQSDVELANLLFSLKTPGPEGTLMLLSPMTPFGELVKKVRRLITVVV